MLISLFNGLKGAINITNVFDPASIEETNRRQEEERKEREEKSALSGMLDVMLGEDAHTVQKEMDESKETAKTKETNEQAKTKEKSILSGIMDVALGEDAHTVQKEMDESKETAKTKEATDNTQEKEQTSSITAFLRQSGAKSVTFDDEPQQDTQKIWETTNER